MVRCPRAARMQLPNCINAQDKRSSCMASPRKIYKKLLLTRFSPKSGYRMPGVKKSPEPIPNTVREGKQAPKWPEEGMLSSLLRIGPALSPDKRRLWMDKPPI